MYQYISSVRYTITQPINKGTFGEVYDAIDKISQQIVAIKIERNENDSQLPFEAHIYKQMQGICGFLQFYEFGYNKFINYIVIERGQQSLQQYIEKHKQISDYAVFKQLSIGLLQSVQALHQSGFIHRDIKPQNIMIRWNDQNDEVTPFLIDFGLSCKYRDNFRGHCKFKDDKKGFVGTARYASVNIHFGNEPARRDDLESLCYVLVYVMRGKLPWQHMPAAGGQDKYQHIREKKINTSIEDLTKNLPQSIADLLRYCRSLGFYDDPDYERMIQMFR